MIMKIDQDQLNPISDRVVRGRTHPTPLEAFANTVDDLVAGDRSAQQQQSRGDQFLGVAFRW